MSGIKDDNKISRDIQGFEQADPVSVQVSAGTASPPRFNPFPTEHDLTDLYEREGRLLNNDELWRLANEKDKNNPERVIYLSLLHERGDLQATFDLAHSYNKGKAIEQDLEKAFKLLLYAAQQCHELQDNIAKATIFNYLLYWGKTQAHLEKMPAVLNLLTQFADEEDASAQFYVGQLYTYGLHFQVAEVEQVGVDLEKATNYLLKALKQNQEGAAYVLKRITKILNYGEAGYKLGQMYLLGDGVQRNHAQALKYLRLAADTGHKKALELLDELERKTSKPKP